MCVIVAHKFSRLIARAGYSTSSTSTLFNTTEYMCEALRTVIGLSPPGTRPDCFRHYELLTAGDIVVTTEHPNGTHSAQTCARISTASCR